MRLNEYVIPFSGYKAGLHTFDFQPDPSFFDQFESTDVTQIRAQVKVNMEKSNTMLIFTVEVHGSYVAPCHRCNADVKNYLFTDGRYIVKFGEEEFTETDEILVLPESAHELDISPLIYETIMLAIPARIVHENENDCDQEVLAKLRQHETDEDETDPRWEALKNLKPD